MGRPNQPQAGFREHENNKIELAVHAVSSEPVSGAEAAISLLYREKQGIFANIARESPIHMV
jgi:hypothetical protein